MGPKPPPSTVLTKAEEALIVTLRRHTLLPLADGLSALQAALPHLTRSARHRCLKRHGISRLPEIAGTTPQKNQCTPSPSGYCHIDIAAVRTEEGTLSRFGAIERTSRCAYAARHPAAWKTVAAQCLRHRMAAVPNTRHPVLTANGIHLTHREQDNYAFKHIFARVCAEHASAHRLTTTNHPWTNGQVERMNRTLKEAPVKTDDDHTHQHLKGHLQAFLRADNFAKRLKPLRGLTPSEHLCQGWSRAPERLTINPYHHTLGQNS
jgi:Integrase core domain